MVAVEHPDPPEEAKFNKFNTEQMGVPPRAQPNDAFVDEAIAREKSYVDMVPGEQLQVDADELSSGNEAHANFFGVLLFGNMASPNYPNVGDRPEPGSPGFEALRTQAVVIQRLRRKLCQIEVLRQRVKQGCELDAAQHKSLRREAEVRATLESAEQQCSREFGLYRPRRLHRPQHQPCVAVAQIGPNSQHKEQSALVQRPQQPRATVAQIGPGSPQKSEVQSDLNNPRPLTKPSGPQEHKEQSTLVQRPQQSCATEAQIGPNSQHKEQSALVQRRFRSARSKCRRWDTVGTALWNQPGWGTRRGARSGTRHWGTRTRVRHLPGSSRSHSSP